jgi:hypothetical protein
LVLLVFVGVLRVRGDGGLLVVVVMVVVVWCFFVQ